MGPVFLMTGTDNLSFLWSVMVAVSSEFVSGEQTPQLMLTVRLVTWSWCVEAPGDGGKPQGGDTDSIFH